MANENISETSSSIQEEKLPSRSLLVFLIPRLDQLRCKRTLCGTLFLILALLGYGFCFFGIVIHVASILESLRYRKVHLGEKMTGTAPMVGIVCCVMIGAIALLFSFGIFMTLAFPKMTKELHQEKVKKEVSASRNSNPKKNLADPKVEVEFSDDFQTYTATLITKDIYTFFPLYWLADNHSVTSQKREKRQFSTVAHKNKNAYVSTNGFDTVDKVSFKVDKNQKCAEITYSGKLAFGKKLEEFGPVTAVIIDSKFDELYQAYLKATPGNDESKFIKTTPQSPAWIYRGHFRFIDLSLKGDRVGIKVGNNEVNYAEVLQLKEGKTIVALDGHALFGEKEFQSERNAGLSSIIVHNIDFENKLLDLTVKPYMKSLETGRSTSFGDNRIRIKGKYFETLFEQK